MRPVNAPADWKRRGVAGEEEWLEMTKALTAGTRMAAALTAASPYGKARRIRESSLLEFSSPVQQPGD